MAMLHIILPFLLTGMTWLLVYRLLPVIACQLDRRLAATHTAWTESVRSGRAGQRIFGKRLRLWLDRLDGWLRQAGYHGEAALTVYLLLVLLPVPVFVLLGCLAGLGGGTTCWPGLIAVTVINSRISGHIRNGRKRYMACLYKIYRFLNLQISAGVRVTDALRGLPEATRDPVIRPVLVRFAARYELSLDLDQAMSEIRAAFPGTDSEMLATHLRQCLQTGQAGRTLARMEELLFARYFSQMQEDTRKVRTQLLRVAILGIAPGVLVFLYPLLWQALQALQSVFG